MTMKQKRLVGALFLAITAPTEAKTAQCVAMAEQIACGMTKTAIENCKALAALAAKRACDGFVSEKARLN